MGEEQERTLFVGNLSSGVTEELLFELFLQAGPLENVTIPTKFGKQKNYGFVVFKHNASVPYAAALMDQVSLFGKPLTVRAHGRYQDYDSVGIRERLGPSEEMNDSLRGFTASSGRNRRLDSRMRPLTHSNKSMLSSEMEMIASLPDSLSPMDYIGPPPSGRSSLKSHGFEKRRYDPSYDRNSQRERGHHRSHSDDRPDTWNPSAKHRRNDDFTRDGSREYSSAKHRGGEYRYHHSERPHHRRH